MTTNVEGIAHGPQGQSMEVTWGDVSRQEAPTLASEMEETIYSAFPQVFGCDPTHVEVHIKESA